MINSNKVIKSGFHQSLANDSVPSLALSHQESIPEKSSGTRLSAPAQPSDGPTSPAEYSGQLSQLYKQILLLNNDLTFERYMKQQHMIHIGELRRRQVREAATEAETQNLIMANRNLKHRLEDAKKAEMQAKKESENRRTLAKNWEKDLSAKLKTLREEQKKWTTEGAALKRELEAKKDEAERLTKIVCEFETKELNAKQSVQVVDQNVAEHERLKAEVTRLTVSERTYQAKEKQMELAVVEANESSSRAELLQMQLTARESELQQTKELFQSQIVVLNTKLQEALKNSRASRNIDTSTMIEKVLADSRAKQSELQKQYSLLMRKYTVLQSSLLDMTANSNVHPGRGVQNTVRKERKDKKKEEPDKKDKKSSGIQRIRGFV
ncbi:putative tuberous sclerosis 1 protein [Phaeoacremonium minimum UCRPA7]|uniref:Putative tuberous sclerosis 1 protein n=1 Tax=Phaeoacremonium minimum (strain UCR-PA7) TaxID=1286976 RepID=R8BX34_PHAM7|nr:putative tuberous sclerosis 1 protein [Phaeoacremonium minimum UCRPA7]EOO03897.1 putative tuberous sclerosis 1 protein [Phaeoacremonium minimum UCRPA7]